MAAFMTIVVLGAALLAMPCQAALYTVGGASGWDLTTNFVTWLNGKSFHAGDTLEFKYTSMHNVVEVSKADYAGCQAGNALKTYTDGNTTVSLKTAGTRYFICGVPGHCSGGMKIAVPVKAAASATPAAAPAAISPSASATPTLAMPKPTPSTDDNSFATATAVSVGLVFANAVMAAAGECILL